MDRSILKQKARESLGGGIFQSAWLTALALCLIPDLVPVIIGAFTSPKINFSDFSYESLESFSYNFHVSPFGSILSIVSLIVAIPLSYGLYKALLLRAKYNAPLDFSHVIDGFKDDFGGILALGLLETLFITLWSMLFLIPGIVKSYAYSFAYYVKIDHPEYDWHACLDESKRLTQGHKGELFVLDLSFIGWLIVGTLALGVGTFWVAPYMATAKIHAYLALTWDDPAYTVPGVFGANMNAAAPASPDAPAAPAAPFTPTAPAAPSSPESPAAPAANVPPADLTNSYKDPGDKF